MWSRSSIGGVAALAIWMSTFQASGRDIVLDVSIPFSVGAQQRHVDVPSSMFWGNYQMGQFGAWHYRIFPDGAATFQGPESRRDILCSRTPLECRDSLGPIVGDIGWRGDTVMFHPVSEQGNELISAYAQWVITGQLQPPIRFINTACLASAHHSAQLQGVQRKLAEAGMTPGPIDGLWGPRTAAALEALAKTSPQSVILAEVEQLC